MKLQLYTIGFLLFTTLNLHATVTYTVDDLILEAIKKSPDLKISALQYDASKQKSSIASSEYLPKVDLHAELGLQGLKKIPTDTMTNDTLILGTLSAKELLYDFGRTGGNVEAYDYESDAYYMANEQYISDKKRDVKLAYYKILQALALIEVYKENVKLNAAQLYRAQKYFQAGIRTKIDISDAKVQLIKAKLDLQESQYDVELSYAALDKIIGFKNKKRGYIVYSQKLDLNNLFDTLSDYSFTLDKSITYAYTHRKEIKKILAQIKSAQARNKFAKADYYPAVYLSADYTKQKLDTLQSVIPQDQWKAALNMNWNLYEGGATKASVQEQKIETDIAQSTLQKTRLLIKEQTTQAFINVKKTKDLIALSQALVGAANEKYIQASKRYENGLSDFIELQQARNDYIQAKTSLIINYYKYYAAIALLDNVIGK